nr:hypothetical protein [Tanacetum cinerariifolium]
MIIVDVFMTILDIYPRVEGANFTDVPDDDTTHAFLIKLGYEGPLYKHTNMFMGHMHQPLRTLAAIINKGLSGKTASNDKLQSEPKSEPVKKKTSSKRRVKKKVTLSADDNIISNDLDTALELGKSISQTEAEEVEAAKQVHVIHARIVIEYVPEPTKRRKSGKVPFDPPKKLKGVPSLTLEEQEAANVMQALKESKKSSKRQPGTGTKPGVPDEKKEITEVNLILEYGSGHENEHSEEDKLDDKEKDDKEGNADDEIESDEDDIYKYKIHVHKDEDEEMINVKLDDSVKGDEEVTDAVKADAKKASKVKDDAKKIELPPTSSSLYVSSSFGDQFLKLSFDSSLSPSMLSIPIFVIFEPTVLTHVQESPLIATATTLPPPSITTTPYLRVAKLEKDVSDLKKIDISAKALGALQTQVPSIVDNYIGSKILKIKREQAKKQQTLKFIIKSTDQATLNEYDQKSALYQIIKHDDEDPSARSNQGKKIKRRRTKESESSKNPSTTKETSKGKTPSKGSKTGKSASAKEPVKEPIADVVMDDVGDDVVCDDDQPYDTSEPKTAKTRNLEWFTQPARPSTPDPE